MESMYEAKNPYHPGSLFKMHERCSHCSTKYKIEPSFFYGAMYVSYAVGIAFAVAAFVISFLLFGASLLQAFISIIGTLILFMPVIIRLSRNIWINFFIHYDADAVRKTEASRNDS
jgi:Ca2+-dependent lipid-binding protein